MKHLPIPTSRFGRKKSAIASILVAFLSSALLSNPAAQAIPLTPMQRCQANMAPDVPWSFTQSGNTGGVGFPTGPNPPNGIFPGNVVRVVIDESSRVSINFWGESYGVDGKSESATSGFPFPGWPKFGNFYRFNNNPTGWVASGLNPDPWAPHPLRELTVCTFAPNIPVRWGTQINDDYIGDNGGNWRFTLQIWR